MDPVKNDVFAKGNLERIGIDGRVKYTIIRNGEEIKNSYDKALPNHVVAVQEVLGILTSDEYGVIDSIDEIEAIGHRVVHGGEKFNKSVLLTEEVVAGIEEVVPLAPLHNPANLEGIRACKEAMPSIPQIAVFDTAFHQTMPASAYTYAIPTEYYEKYSVRRYGFHGTSHKYVSSKAAEYLGEDIENLNIITCHLGNGASIAAVKGGKSVDTSMGMTPLAGLPMGTRSGDIDPAIFKYLIDQTGALTVDDIDRILNKESGFLGVSGVSSDMRDVEIAAAEGNERADLALEVFYTGIKRYIGSYTATMGGADAIVFTAGIGENSAETREEVLEGLEGLGIILDKERNNNVGDIGIISTDDSKVKVLVVATDEEYVIARDTLEIVNAL